MSTSQRKLDWIQALRGMAALMVVIVHSRSVLLDSATGRVIANTVMLPLAMGVDLFFIISGFLMVVTTRDFDGSAIYAMRFLAKRMARIWPLFAVVSMLAIAVDHHGLHGYADRSTWWPYAEGLLFIPHNPAASGIYFQMAVGVAWTLCFECYFYLVFAACMFCGTWRYRVMTIWFALTLLVIPWLRGGYTLQVDAQPLIAWSRYANLLINPINGDFVFGMLAGWLYVHQWRVRHASTVYLTLTILLGALLLGWHRIGMVDFFGPRGWGLPLAILFVGVVLLGRQGGVRVPAWSVWLGEASYSLYLLHVYVFELAQRIVKNLAPAAHSAHLVLLVTRPVLAVIVAGACFRYLERPLSEWTRRRLLHPLASKRGTAGITHA